MDIKIKCKTKPKNEEEYDLNKSLQSTVLSFGSNSYPTHRGTVFIFHSFTCLKFVALHTGI